MIEVAPSRLDFTIAKALIPIKVSELKIYVPDDCTAYYRTGDEGTMKEWGKEGNNCIKVNPDTTVYWIKNHTVTVPIGKPNFGFCTLQCEINGKIFFENQLADLDWQTEYRDGVTYFYLTDYFVDVSYGCIQKGLAITIRKLLKDKIIDKIIKEYKQKTETQICPDLNNAYGKYGLKFSDLSFKAKQHSSDVTASVNTQEEN